MMRGCPKPIGKSANLIGEAADELRWLGGSLPFSEAIKKAAELCGLPYWRAYNLFYRKASRIDPQEVEFMSEAMQREAWEIERDEIRRMRLRLLMVDAEFNAKSPALDRPPSFARRAFSH